MWKNIQQFKTAMQLGEQTAGGIRVSDLPMSSDQSTLDSDCLQLDINQLVKPLHLDY